MSYVYGKRSVGTTRRDIFIGRADDPAVIARATLIEEENGRAGERRQIVSALVRAHVPAPVCPRRCAPSPKCSMP